MPSLTPRGEPYSSKKGASPGGEAPSFFALCASARDDQTLAGDDHPAAVLLADSIDAANAGNGIAGINLEDAAAALDQRAAISDVAQHPAFNRRQQIGRASCRERGA